MIKQHFIRAAETVKAILNGNWTNEPPEWEGRTGFDLAPAWHEGREADYVRAVHTAEAFILLLREYNPRFNQETFLIACGLAEKPSKARGK